MNTRRHFITSLATAGAVLALRVDALAKSRAKSVPTFTKRVRELTLPLTIAPERWEWVVGHHSGIKHGNAAIYDRVHRERGMENGLAYHFVIGNGLDSGDGEIETGSRWLKQLPGGHVRRAEINEAGIGICVVGNFEVSKPSARQMLAFRELVHYLRSGVATSGMRFAVHREIDPGHTACPGRNFPVAQLHRWYGKFVPVGAA